MSNISFDNVYLLLIAVPLIILCVVPFAIAVRKSNRNKHNLTSLILHIVMAALIAFAAAGPYLSTVVTETDVYVVADVSYSTKSNLDTIDRYIKNLNLPSNSKLGLVCFGKDYQLVSELGNPKAVASVKSATVDDTETNVAAALTYTGTLFKADVIKRIVLITDGMQTDRSAENSIRRAVDGLVNQRIQVDAIFVNSNPDLENHTEVQISGVQASANVYLNSDQVANLTVQSSYETAATVRVKRNGTVIEEGKPVLLTTGVNIVEIALDTSEAGTFEYEATVIAPGDTGDKNNTYTFTQIVSDELKMLVVTESWSDCVAIIERYDGRGVLDIYENDTKTSTATKNAFLSSYHNNGNVTLHLNTMSIPFSIEELCTYDEIVLANVNISNFTNYPSFIINMKDAVSNFGKSLITMGNLYIQNRDFGDDMEEWDLFQTYEGMLPVRYGNSDDDPKLYTFVIDTSRSMGHLYHLDIVKELLPRLIQQLNESDYVSLFTFDGEVMAYYNAESLKNRDAIIDTIEHLEVANGTMLGSGLRRAYDQIKNLRYSEKQVLLITDGISFGDDPYQADTVVAEMSANEIVTSVFDVGRQGDGANGSNVDETLAAAGRALKALAEIGMGNYYYSNNAEWLPDDIFGAVADDMTESVVEKEASVNVEVPRDAIFENIDLRNVTFPKVSGYVYSGIKPSATTVLTLNHMRSSGVTVEKPLYAHWQHGAGKVSSFTSSIGSWTEKWEGDLKDAFFDTLYTINVPAEKNENPFALDIEREGSGVTVNVKLPALLALGTTATIVVTAPDGTEISDNMLSTGSAYYYTFNAPDIGKYAIDVTYTRNGQAYSMTKYIYNCYIDEYDAFTIFDASELYMALNDRGTVSEDGALTLENDRDAVDKYIVTFTIPLLIIAVALFVVDIVVRKLTWDDVRSFFGFGGKRKKEGKRQ